MPLQQHSYKILHIHSLVYSLCLYNQAQKFIFIQLKLECPITHFISSTGHISIALCRCS